MFKVIDNPTFTRTVKVSVPSDGGYRTETLKCTYRVLPTEEAKKFDLADSDQARDFLVAIIERLDDIADGDGNAIQYSDAVRDHVISMPYARVALAREYVEAVAGARLGN